MRIIRFSILTVAGLIALNYASTAWSNEPMQPDNSAQNAQDRQGSSLTPMDQSQDPEDIRITREIRRLLTEDGSLSSNAKNVKVITVNGAVTLRGPVNSQAEKSAIEAHARKVTADRTMSNLIEVKTNPVV